MLNIKKFRKSEKGNALFLILIAVALFAALSYAITQSGRGGGGVDKEQALITASQITQYAAGLRTTVTRMSITGTSLLEFEFDNDDSDADNEVFNSAGGGAIEQDPPSGAGATAYAYIVPATSTTGQFLDDIGGDTSPDIFVVTDASDDLNSNVCQEINRGLGLATDPVVNGAAYDDTTAAATYDGSTSAAGVIDALPGEAFGCVYSGTATTTNRIYFHALVEN